MKIFIVLASRSYPKAPDRVVSVLMTRSPAAVGRLELYFVYPVAGRLTGDG